MNDILAAAQGKFNNNGQVLLLLHVAQYGLNITEDRLKLLLETIKIHRMGKLTIYTGILLALYRTILIKMGYASYLLRNYMDEQMLAIILTGVNIEWPTMNLYSNRRLVNMFGRPDSTFLHQTYDYYNHLYQNGLISKINLITKFQIPAYSNVDYRNDSFNIKLFKYVHTDKLIKTELETLYPSLPNEKLMHEWSLHKGVIANISDYPISYYDATLPTAQLAAKYGIANIYARNYLLIIIKAIYIKFDEIYYRRANQTLGNGYFTHARDKTDIGLYGSDPITFVQSFLDWTQGNMDIDNIIINFITFAHAFNIMDCANDHVFTYRYFRLFVITEDYEVYKTKQNIH